MKYQKGGTTCRQNASCLPMWSSERILEPHLNSMTTLVGNFGVQMDGLVKYNVNEARIRGIVFYQTIHIVFVLRKERDHSHCICASEREGGANHLSGWYTVRMQRSTPACCVTIALPPDSLEYSMREAR